MSVFFFDFKGILLFPIMNQVKLTTPNKLYDFSHRPLDEQKSRGLPSWPQNFAKNPVWDAELESEDDERGRDDSNRESKGRSGKPSPCRASTDSQGWLSTRKRTCATCVNEEHSTSSHFFFGQWATIFESEGAGKLHDAQLVHTLD